MDHFSFLFVMRYFYENKNLITTFGKVVELESPYRFGTLFKYKDRGIIAVQLYFDESERCFYYSSLEQGLANDIYLNSNFKSYMEVNATKPYTIIDIRKLMWALRMKPLRKSYTIDI